jgi:hypothetical protein
MFCIRSKSLRKKCSVKQGFGIVRAFLRILRTCRSNFETVPSQNGNLISSHFKNNIFFTKLLLFLLFEWGKMERERERERERETESFGAGRTRTEKANTL